MKLPHWFVCLALVPMLQAVPNSDRVSTNDLYQQKCGRCHTAHSPGSYPMEQWPALLASMRDDANLNPAEETRLLGWLVEESARERANLPANDGTASPRLSGYLYTEYMQTPVRKGNFDLHYLALALEGWPRPRLHYLAEFELEHGGKGDNTFVEQAWLEVWLPHSLAIRVGALLVPFNRFDDYHEPHLNPLVTRPLAASEIGVSAWKEVGVQLHGHRALGPMVDARIDVYAVNGLGDGTTLRSSRQYRDNNESLTAGARVATVLHNRLELGVSAARGRWDDSGTLDLQHTGAHLLLTVPWFTLHGEFARVESENPDSLEAGVSEGWFLSLTRHWNPVLHTSLRGGSLDQSDPGNPLGRAALERQQDEWSAGVGYAPWPEVLFKMEYTIYGERSPMANTNNDLLALQAALRF